MSCCGRESLAELKEQWGVRAQRGNGSCCCLQTRVGQHAAAVYLLPGSTHAAAWEAERATVCEGIQHETALEVDPAEKGQLLRLATEQLAAQQAAAEAARQQGRRRPQQRAGQG